ncbi:WXG100 family type VII secretion target [Bifidobacterium sp. 7101]|uniref:WXG100 family type VII secretion target n=1 Tax=Bifidobacterium sp. 7101 TaxID=1394175 RepID=UPI0004218CA7|nr:WXG100 family type VII secretion target [Bifidobacterium sp. 7101]
MSLGLDWWAIDVRFDPVPGDPAGVRQCAAEARSKSSTVESLKDRVSRIRSSYNSGSVFVGKAADKFISKLDDFPSNLSSLSNGLNAIYKTLDSWSACMEDCQRRAGNAYHRAVAAKNSVSNAQSQLVGACGDAANADRDLLQVKRTLGADVDDADMRRAQRRADAAQGQVASFRRQLDNAQGLYDAARSDVFKVGDEYINGADAAVRGLNGALDDLPPVSVFDRVYYSDTWRTIVKVAEVAANVVGVAMLLLGPGGILGLLAFALAAVGFANDVLAYSHGDENLWQVGLGFLSLFLASLGGFMKQSAAGVRFFAESKGLPMYQRVIGGLNSSGRNSGMVTDFMSVFRKDNFQLIHDTGIWKDRKAFDGICRNIISGNNKEVTRIFNDFQLRSLSPHDWKWILGKSDLYGVFNQADVATIRRYGMDTTSRRALREARKTLRKDAKLNVAKDLVDAARRIEDHKAEGKTGYGAGMTEWAGLLAPAVPVLGLAGEVADSRL